MLTKKQDKSLYFIALVPEEPVYTEVWQMKEEMRERFATKAALRSPPHITLQMPFKWDVKKEELLFRVLAQLTESYGPFKITFKDFGAFEPRVIYVGLETSTALNDLQKAVAKVAASEWHIYPRPDSRPFRPHMTIAFRDLKKPLFYEAWQEFKDRRYQNVTPVNKLCLLKHNGQHWVEYQYFDLKAKGQPD